jgi:hypothetical protein
MTRPSQNGKLSAMRLSRLVPVRQHFPSRALPDVTAAVRQELAAKETGAGLAPGARIAIGAGSRGVANISTIVRATAAHFRDLGHQPFVFPAMGSHGGGTAQGQIDVLAHYNITESQVGCPILSSMDTVPLGVTLDGIETYMDRNAFESDGAFLVNRVKWHTSFEAPIESGVVKMAAIGMGKLKGATNYHRHAVRLGLGTVIASAGRHVLTSGKILGGLAILEDAHHDTAQVVSIPAAHLEHEEPKLLETVRSWMSRILFDEVDILIVEEIGKHISGVGMDSKIVNRHPYGGANMWPWAPKILRIYVRDISPLSYGNAVGIGMVEMLAQRAYEKIDWQATKVNAFAASNLTAVRTPLRADSDEQALQILTAAVGRSDPSEVTFVWIRNTLELSDILVSENLLNTSRERDDIEQTGDPSEWDFDAQGDLTNGFAPVAALAH